MSNKKYNVDFSDNPPPFWRQFGFFFGYLKQEKLYYQITLLAFANILLLIPSIIIAILVGAMLFLASYKLAFEVLHTVSSGRLIYADSGSYEIDDKIGFKAIVMAVLQLLIYLFIYRYDPPVGLALLIFTTVATPAYLMMLSKTQDIWSSLNPISLMTVMTRIGFEYGVLLVFFLLCAAFNLVFRYYTADLMPGIISDVVSAWVLYFLLVFTFLVIGYVMYRHADELGHDTVDTEVAEAQPVIQTDPIKERIKLLIAEQKPQEAIAIIKDLQQSEPRTDLSGYLSEAENLLLLENRRRPVDQLQKLVDEKQFKKAIAMMQSYIADGHFIKPQQASTLSQLIRYAFDNNQSKTVLQLCQRFDQHYPQEHQQIVDNFFLVAKIQYQYKKIDQAEKLLTSLLNKYGNSANTEAVNSYLIGIQKLRDE
ncbi:hypothetical protein MNBD_GAMMA02-1219 [hydrothermal vent metagenome]|uniref:Uncharacterized protein n=1 Tax=hydrothermal vent metagenome TaxID=652676 RepID=A0A3B0WRN2_9ZZZZ